MYSLHVEFDLCDSPGMSECAAAALRLAEGAPTLSFLRVAPRRYSDVYDLCRALSDSGAAPSGFECLPGADGRVLCRAAEIWRPYVNCDIESAPHCEMLWNLLGFDTCADYVLAREQRASTRPHFGLWFDSLAELPPPSIELLACQSISSGGGLAQSVYGCRRTALLSLRHMDAECTQSYRDLLDLAVESRRLRLFKDGGLLLEGWLDCGGDADPSPRRMYAGCEAWAADLPLILA